ncbi:Homeobox protein Meis2 [Xenoophorus captivus]|uniref:Homeobox protein Meis2 n=1 Tax=Xenoophorus captivus TaxID=1517983 RepID=A0ABV0R3L6_9TELE
MSHLLFLFILCLLPLIFVTLCCCCFLTLLFFQTHTPHIYSLPVMPGEYVPQSSPMGMSMGPPIYSNPHQMPSHPSQLRHGPPPHHAYLPDHPNTPHTMLMHGGPSLHPGMTMSAQKPPLLTHIVPSTGGHGLDIHAQ